MKALGVNASSRDFKSLLSDHDFRQMIQTGLNLSDLLCARLQRVARRSVGSGRYEVTCVAYHGGSSTKTYIVDSAEGVAFEP